MIDGITRRLVSQQRDLERPPPRQLQRREHVVEHALEQVAETRVREPALRLRRSRREHTRPCERAQLDARQPERRLADPGVTLEHERGRPVARLVHERRDDGELLVPADDLERHLPRDDRDRDARNDKPLL